LFLCKEIEKKWMKAALPHNEQLFYLQKFFAGIALLLCVSKMLSLLL